MRECAAASSDPAAYYRAFEAYHPRRPAGLARGGRGFRPLPRLAGRGFHDRRGDRARRRQHGGPAMSALEFSGKRVLVTGSTRGIGRATAELIHARGGEVIWHGRRQERGAERRRRGGRQPCRRRRSRRSRRVSPDRRGGRRGRCPHQLRRHLRAGADRGDQRSALGQDHRRQSHRRLDAVAGACWTGCAAGGA